jgi:hypothetical protein
MSSVSIVAVDERDSGWEDHRPRFRVYLHGSGESSTGGWTATYDVTGADVLQVIDWVQAQAADVRTYAVALVYDDGAKEGTSPEYGRGLVWLVGMDGNDHEPEDAAVVGTQERMLKRRSAPVGIPVADRMPPDVLSVAPEIFDKLDAAQPPH